MKREIKRYGTVYKNRITITGNQNKSHKNNVFNKTTSNNIEDHLPGFEAIVKSFEEELRFLKEWSIVGFTDKPLGVKKESYNRFFDYRNRITDSNNKSKKIR